MEEDSEYKVRPDYTISHDKYADEKNDPGYAEDERIAQAAYNAKPPIDKELAFQEKEREIAKQLYSHDSWQVSNNDVIDLAADAAALDPDMEEAIMDAASILKSGNTWELNMPVEEATKILSKSTNAVNQELKNKNKRGTAASRYVYLVNALFAKIASY